MMLIQNSRYRVRNHWTTNLLNKVGSLLGQRRRRWPNNEPISFSIYNHWEARIVKYALIEDFRKGVCTGSANSESQDKQQ